MNKKNVISLSLFLIAFAVAGAFFVRPAFAVVKDSDADGLSDEAERTVYGTNPLVVDTDGDGISDGAEILAGTNPLDSMSSQLAELALPDPGILGSPVKFSWYLGRASGILAFILLTLVTCFGLLMSSRVMTKYLLPATIYEMHRFLSFASLLAVFVHATSFFFDEFFHLSFVEAVIPFFLQREYQSVLGFDIGKTMGLGIIALYLMLLLILTSEFRAKMSLRLWRVTHYTSFIAYLLFILHGFASGTDSREWWMQAIYIASAVSVFILILFRIFSRSAFPKKAVASAVAPMQPGIPPTDAV
jgi:hypothetical protein